MSRARAKLFVGMLAVGCATALLIGCSDDAKPADGGVVNRDGPPPSGDGPVTPKGDGAVTPVPDGAWADKGVLQCAEGIPANCCDLMRQHEQALAEAKACTAGSTSCNKLIVGDLPCACKTFVDGSSPAAAKMTELEGQWKAASCPGGKGCSACQDPKSASCETLGLGTKCVDKL